MCFQKPLYVLVLVALLSGSTMAFAQTCPGTPIDFGPTFGAPATGNVILTGQLSDCGVVFSTTNPEGVFWFGDSGVPLFSDCIHAGNLAGETGPTGGIDPIRIDFDSPVGFVSIRGFDTGGDVETLILEAYDSGDNLVDTHEITNAFTDPGLTATVSGSIAYATVRVEGALEGLFFDDLNFGETAPPLPCPGPPIDFGPAFAAPVTGFVVLTDQLAHCGVDFSTTSPEGVYWIGGSGYSSFPDCIHAGSLAGETSPTGGIDPIRIDFSTLVSTVSIRGYDGGGDTDTMVLEGYDTGGNLVDTNVITDTFTFPGSVASVTGSIAYVVVSVEGTTAGLFFDDLDFGNTVPVEETTWGAIKAMYR